LDGVEFQEAAKNGGIFGNSVFYESGGVKAFLRCILELNLLFDDFQMFLFVLQLELFKICMNSVQEVLHLINIGFYIFF